MLRPPEPRIGRFYGLGRLARVMAHIALKPNRVNLLTLGGCNALNAIEMRNSNGKK